MMNDHDPMPIWANQKKLMRVAVCTSGSGMNLEKLIEYERTHVDVGFTIAAIFSDTSTSRACEIAQRCRIPYMVHGFREFIGAQKITYDLTEVRTRYDAVLAAFLTASGADLIALAGYDQLVSPSILNSYPIIGVHPADLRIKKPGGKVKYTGPDWVPIAKALFDTDQYLANGKPCLCATTHIVTEDVSNGPIIMTGRMLEVELSRDQYAYNEMRFLNPNQLIAKKRRGEQLVGNERVLVDFALRHQKYLEEKECWVTLAATLKLIAQGRVVYCREEDYMLIDGNHHPGGVECHGQI